MGALANLGHKVSVQTVGNIPRRHDLAPAPQRSRTTTWKEFLRSHMDVLAGADFFTVDHLSGVACLVREETGIAARTGCDGGIVRISRLVASKADCHYERVLPKDHPLMAHWCWQARGGAWLPVSWLGEWWCPVGQPR